MIKRGFCLFTFLIISLYSYAEIPKYYYGIASYYGDEFIGQKTASGDIYDPHQLTAAHESLPFGTKVEVENLENGRKVQVLINDRGSFSEGRIIELSKKAAEQLDFLKKGTTYVMLTVLELGKDTTNVPVNSNSKTTPSKISYKDKPFLSIKTNYNGKTLQLDYYILNQINKLRTADNTLYITNQQIRVVTNIVPAFAPDESILDKEVDDKLFDIDHTNDSDSEFILEEPLENPFEFDIDYTSKQVQISNKNEVDLEPYFPDTDQDELEPLPNYDILFPENDSSANLENESISDESKVELTKLSLNGDTKPDISNTPAPNGYSFALQVGAFTKYQNAQLLYDRLKDLGYNVILSDTTINGINYTRVRIVYFDTLEQAMAIANELKKMNLPVDIWKIKFSQ